jgi:phosphoribosyl-AMP cyclohydrolase
MDPQDTGGAVSMLSRPIAEPEALVSRIDFSKMDGLVPVVTQDVETGEVLMLAFADAEAVRRTAATGYAHYYSRSRGRIWKKGESSGHLQHIVELRIDCDEDSLLYMVRQTGAACHTGYFSCFYRRAAESGLTVVGRRPEENSEAGTDETSGGSAASGSPSGKG